MFPDDLNYGFDPYMEYMMYSKNYTKEELDQAQTNGLRAILAVYGSIFAAAIIAGILKLFHVIWIE